MKIEDHKIKVYFRIPFTMYFLCRLIISIRNIKDFDDNDNIIFETNKHLSKFYICTKRFSEGKYYWNVMK